MTPIVITGIVTFIVGGVAGFFIGIFTFRKQLERMQNDPDMMAKMTQDPDMMKRVAKQMGLNQQQVNKVQQMMKSRTRKKK